MPLLDHFNPPFSKQRHWESFHATWIGSIADALNANLLPQGYFAEEQVQPSADLEIDVATFEDQASERVESGGTAIAARKTWTPAAATWTIPGVVYEGVELLVFQNDGGTRVVAAIELISPANKDRPETRRTFAAKCASYLSAGVSLIVIDVVTPRKANLHNELVAMLGQESGSCQSPAEIYAVGYRPLLRNSNREIEIWPAELAIGKSLPELPLWIAPDLAVPINLETAYQDACRRRRLIA
jgi:hypothetical protein